MPADDAYTGRGGLMAPSPRDFLDQLGLAPSGVLRHIEPGHRVSVNGENRNLWTCSECDWFFWLRPPFVDGDVLTAQQINASLGGRFVPTSEFPGPFIPGAHWDGDDD